MDKYEQKWSVSIMSWVCFNKIPPNLEYFRIPVECNRLFLSFNIPGLTDIKVDQLLKQKNLINLRQNLGQLNVPISKSLPL